MPGNVVLFTQLREVVPQRTAVLVLVIALVQMCDASAGDPCTTNAECPDSNLCAQRCCRTSIDPGSCTECTSSGACKSDSCAADRYYNLFNGECVEKAAPGTGCSLSSQCLSGICEGGFFSKKCCKSTVGEKCSSCSSSGDCTACSSGYELKDGSCLDEKEAGESCTANVDCKDGNCQGGRCCKTSVGSSCATCDSSGDCTACDVSHFVENGRCIAKKSDGDVCASDAQCSAGNCHGHCCKPVVVGSCTACDSSGGCSACSAATHLVNGNCVDDVADSVSKTVSTSSSTSITETTFVSASPSVLSQTVTPGTSRTGTVPQTPSRTKGVSLSVSAQVTVSVSETGIQSASASNPSATVSRGLSETNSLPPTASGTQSGATGSQSPSPSAPSTETVNRGLSRTSTTSTSLGTSTGSDTPSATASDCAAIPAVNVSMISTTQATLEAAQGQFEIPLPWDLASASTYAGEDLTGTKVDASALRVRWERPTEYLPSDLDSKGTLPQSSVTASLVLFDATPERNETTAAMLQVSIDLNEPGAAAFSFSDGFPSELSFELLPGFFAPGTGGYGCLDDLPASVAVGKLAVSATPQPLLLATAQAMQSVAGVAAAASAVAGGGAAGDAISLAIFADMGCARPALKEGGRNRRLLSPAGLDDTRAGLLSGSAIVIVLTPVVHFLSAIGVWQLRVQRGLGAKGGATMTAAMVATRFPSWSLGVHGTLHQGLVYVTGQLVLGEGAFGEGSEPSAGMAVVGVLLSTSVPLALYMLSAACVRATYCEYDFAACESGAGVSRFWRAVLPRGRWEGIDARRQFGVIFAPFERASAAWALLPILSPTLAAVIGSARPTTASGCVWQFGFLAIVMACYGAFLAWRRPFRAVVLNGSAALSTMTLVGVASTSAAQVAGVIPAAWGGRLMLIWIYLQMLATTCRLGFVVVKLFLEGRLTKRVGLVQRLQRTPARWWQNFRGGAAGGGLSGVTGNGVTWGELPAGYLLPDTEVTCTEDPDDGDGDAAGLAKPLLPGSALFAVPINEDSGSVELQTMKPSHAADEAKSTDRQRLLADPHVKRVSIFAMPLSVQEDGGGEDGATHNKKEKQSRSKAGRRRSYSFDNMYFSVSFDHERSASPDKESGSLSAVPLTSALNRNLPQKVLNSAVAKERQGAADARRRRRSMSL